MNNNNVRRCFFLPFSSHHRHSTMPVASCPFIITGVKLKYPSFFFTKFVDVGSFAFELWSLFAAVLTEFVAFIVKLLFARRRGAYVCELFSHIVAYTCSTSRWLMRRYVPRLVSNTRLFCTFRKNLGLVKCRLDGILAVTVYDGLCGSSTQVCSFVEDL